MRENPDLGPIFDTCDNLADSVRLHRPGLVVYRPRRDGISDRCLSSLLHLDVATRVEALATIDGRFAPNADECADISAAAFWIFRLITHPLRVRSSSISCTIGAWHARPLWRR